MSDLLLVDDDRRIVELVAFFLERRGHVVRIASSFAAARVALAERMPDLMLSDVDLGRERAEEELPRLARERLLPPTLVVSGYLDGVLEARMLAVAGVVGTLRKPYDLSALEARIADALAELHESAAARAPLEDPDDGWIEVRATESGA